MSEPTREAMQGLIFAAAALLEARANQMVTAAEWQALRDAVVACGGTVPTEGADADQ